MRRLDEIQSLILLVVSLFAAACLFATCGCSAPAVSVVKNYTVHQYGVDGNEVKVEVLKDETISPQVKASVK